MSMIGTVGEAAVVKTQPDFAIKNVALFKCGDEMKAKWLYYFLCSPNGKGQLYGNQKGSSQQFVSLTQLRNLPIPVTDPSYMNEVVDILSAYDDLIENNQKQIKLLEEAAQRLYKEWFVDLRFPGHETTNIVDGMPEGWNAGVLEDVIEFDPKVKLDKEKLKKSVPMAALSTSSMILDEGQFTETHSNAGSKFQNGDTLLARITPCLENGKTAFVFCLPDTDGAVGSTEYIVMRSKELNPYMVYCIARSNSFRQNAINSMTGADGRQRVQVDKLKSIPYFIPPSDLVEQCGNILQPVFQKINSINQQCLRLKNARDKLLPKLMSGEIEV